MSRETLDSTPAQHTQKNLESNPDKQDKDRDLCFLSQKSAGTRHGAPRSSLRLFLALL
jgi:hypothetical protein